MENKIESHLNWDDQFDFGSGKLSTLPDYSDLLKSIEKLETTLRSGFLQSKTYHENHAEPRKKSVENTIHNMTRT